MKKLFIFLALTQQGFCNDYFFNVIPLSEKIAPYSYMILGEEDIGVGFWQNSYVLGTRTFNSGMDLTEQDLQEWMEVARPVDTHFFVPAQVIQPAAVLHPITVPLTPSTPLGHVKKPTIYNLTNKAITEQELAKLSQLKKFIHERYLDGTGALLCDASNARYGIDDYISDQPWNLTLGNRILSLLTNYGTRQELRTYRKIYKSLG